MKKTYRLGRKRASSCIGDVNADRNERCLRQSPPAARQIARSSTPRRSSDDMPSSSAVIMRTALVLCAVAVPVVGFNIFASSQQNETILYWSLAMTVTFTLFGGAFILWAASILWPNANALYAR